MTNYSRNVAKKEFLRQLTVPPHNDKLTLLHNMYIKEKQFEFFLTKNMLTQK